MITHVVAPAACPQQQPAAPIASVKSARTAAQLAVCYRGRLVVLASILPVPTEEFAAMDFVGHQAEYVALVGSAVTMEQFVRVSTANLPAVRTSAVLTLSVGMAEILPLAEVASQPPRPRPQLLQPQ